MSGVDTRPAGEAEIAARVAEWRLDASSALHGLYGDRAAVLLADVVARATAAARVRPGSLAALDREREREPDWFQRPQRVGYIAYADRFGGDLAGIGARVGHLRELGVDVLHLMSVLRPRPGENDGGYAIEDYRSPDPRLGTVEDLAALAGRLRAAGISLCLDLVMNHTSDTHPWAVAARAGSAYHRRLYRVLTDRRDVDAYEATLPEVFPDLAPGNFTWVDELDAWAWTTFREFQWDLDWSNPHVLLEMVDVLLHLANLGVEIVRLDAVAFTWKRLGTSSQNQPEAHLVVQALRAALGIAAPATILLAEAIVGPEELVAYLGRHERERRECDIAYHNQLMVQSWSMLAEQRAELATGALRRLPTPPARTTWLTYVRCHDDIGWAISDRDALAAGLDGWQHRRFLAAFYRGEYPTSFARGVPFAPNPATGDERTCGMTATLCGIVSALERGRADELAAGVARALLLYAVAFGFGGIPMIYMGDELGQGDDESYLRDPLRAHDARWRQRPALDQVAYAARHDAATVPGALWTGMRRLIDARRACLALHGAASVTTLRSGNRAVFAWLREHPRFGALLGLANVSGEHQRVPATMLHALGSHPVVDVLAAGDTDLLAVAPFQVRWLTTDPAYPPAPAPGPPVLSA